jgi:hypothetical protein
VPVLWDDRAVQDFGGRSGSGPSQERLRRWRRLLADEREAPLVYRDLALRREGEEREILLGLANRRSTRRSAELVGRRVSGSP